MAFAKKQILAGMTAFSLIAAPIAAQADTRAGDNTAAYAVPIGDDDDEGVAVWVYLFGGVALWALLAAGIKGGSSGDKPTIPNNQSNGAN
mgnify:CR=1 FL=1